VSVGRWLWYNREKRSFTEKIESAAKEEYEYPGSREIFPLTSMSPLTANEIEVIGVTYEGKLILCQSVEVVTRERGEGEEKEKERAGGEREREKSVGGGEREREREREKERERAGERGGCPFGERWSFKKDPAPMPVKVNRKIQKNVSGAHMNADSGVSLGHLVETADG
jgi:hypothetical protein